MKRAKIVSTVVGVFLMVAVFLSGPALALNVLSSIHQTGLNQATINQLAESTANGQSVAVAWNLSPTVQTTIQVGRLFAPNVNSGANLTGLIHNEATSNVSMNQTAIATGGIANVAINVAPIVITHVQVGIAVTPTINFQGQNGGASTTFQNDSQVNPGVTQNAQASGGLVNIGLNLGPTVVVNPAPINVNINPNINLP
ncbi:MAG TPA: hypothetical protein VLH40_03350 [Atribacteraceae bacterium]|nr:hypothetical protein [Atribacteraceae bacterium]